MEKEKFLDTDDTTTTDGDHPSEVIGGFWPFEGGTTTGEIMRKKPKHDQKNQI